jgi:hypothetical protein
MSFIEKHKGSKRVTFLIGSVAVKTVSFRYLLNIIKYKLLVFKSKGLEKKMHLDCLEQNRIRFFNGIWENFSEWHLYQLTKASFLTPTYLTFGIFNICKRQYGNKVSGDNKEEEVFIIIKRGLEKLGRPDRISMIDKHSVFDNDGWFVWKGKYFLTDYADCFGSGDLSLSSFLYDEQYHIENILDNSLPNQLDGA